MSGGNTNEDSIRDSKNIDDIGVMSQITGPTKGTEKPMTRSTNTRPVTYMNNSKISKMNPIQYSTTFVKKLGRKGDSNLDKIREGLSTQDAPRRSII
jgi:hypothetical protein